MIMAGKEKGAQLLRLRRGRHFFPLPFVINIHHYSSLLNSSKPTLLLPLLPYRQPNLMKPEI
jgi:hypothetical protein